MKEAGREGTGLLIAMGLTVAVAMGWGVTQRVQRGARDDEPRAQGLARAAEPVAAPTLDAVTDPGDRQPVGAALPTPGPLPTGSLTVTISGPLAAYHALHREPRVRLVARAPDGRPGDLRELPLEAGQARFEALVGHWSVVFVDGDRVTSLVEDWEPFEGPTELDCEAPEPSPRVDGDAWRLPVSPVTRGGDGSFSPCLVVQGRDADGTLTRAAVDAATGVAVLAGRMRPPVTVSIALGGRRWTADVDGEGQPARLELEADHVAEHTGSLIVDLTGLPDQGRGARLGLELTRRDTRDVWFLSDRSIVSGLLPGAYLYRLEGPGLAPTRGAFDVAAGGHAMIRARPAGARSP